ncbi:MAG: MAPEG family protein, partial [Proteobacteria bacterium]|nr:MAPEG family protein [Pseudomonadota bacterium]
PTVFYAVALAIVAGGIADPVYAACAWAFLGCRVLHSLVQATINRVRLRLTFYVLSWLALAVMIVRPLLTA